MSYELVSEQQRPTASPVMYQTWKALLFLHWEWDAAEIQRTLPRGLEVDCFEGKTYIGLVPFFMRSVRPRFFPCVPWLSDFLEMNVRVYVRDRSGRPGVWFYSLDCDQPLAVFLARTLFKLPYFHARMRAQTGPESAQIYYDCKRAGTTESSHLEYLGMGEAVPARAGSLEAFLVERYRLFAGNDSQLYSGEVWHHPYRICPAEVPQWSSLALRQAGFNAGALPPDHCLFSPGVDVSIYPLLKCSL